MASPYRRIGLRAAVHNPPHRLIPTNHAASGEGLACMARHVIRCIHKPGLLSQMASYDVASNVFGNEMVPYHKASNIFQDLPPLPPPPAPPPPPLITAVGFPFFFPLPLTPLPLTTLPPLHLPTGSAASSTYSTTGRPFSSVGGDQITDTESAVADFSAAAITGPVPPGAASL